MFNPFSEQRLAARWLEYPPSPPLTAHHPMPCVTGGLSTFMHSDRIAAWMHNVNPKTRVAAAPVVGYFLDHGNYADNASFTYPDWMNYIYNMQNISGTGGRGDCMEDAGANWG